MSQNGKGSRPRQQTPAERKTYEREFQRIFRSQKRKAKGKR